MISLTSPVETHAHGWSAGAKIGALCAATLVLFGVGHVVWQAVFLGGMLVLYALPGRQFFTVGLARLRGLWPFIAIILLWHVVTRDLTEGILITLRMLTAVGLANLVTITTRLTDMMGVVRWLCTPLRAIGVKSDRIELAMALVIRFTPVLIDKGAMLAMAWRARAARRVGWRIVTPFAVLAIDDAEHVAEALRARGGL
jgi:biotin transport system permease protein